MSLSAVGQDRWFIQECNALRCWSKGLHDVASQMESCSTWEQARDNLSYIWKYLMSTHQHTSAYQARTLMEYCQDPHNGPTRMW